MMKLRLNKAKEFSHKQGNQELVVSWKSSGFRVRPRFKFCFCLLLQLCCVIFGQFLNLFEVTALCLGHNSYCIVQRMLHKKSSKRICGRTVRTFPKLSSISVRSGKI